MPPLPSPSPRPAPRPRLVLLGDSITQQAAGGGGWAAALAHAYRRTADVVLRGYSGYNTDWALRLLVPSAFGATAPAVVALFYGANDAALPDRASAAQHVPIDRRDGGYAANLAAIVRAALAAGAGRVFVLTPPPVDEVACAAHAASTWGAPPGTPPSRTDENAAAYAATALRVAAAEEDPRVVGVDVRSAFLAHPGGWRALLSDGLHLTAGGNGVVHAALAAAVVTAAPELAPESLARAAGGGGVEGRVVPGSHAPPPPLPPPAPPLPPLPVGCRPRVVLLGDEVAEAACEPGGWGARLADAYARTADVVLRGGEGIDSRWAVGLAGDALRCGGGGDGGSLDTRSPLAAAVLLFGGGAAPSRPLLPPLEHASNLCTLAAAALGAGARAVVITTPMPDSAERAVPHAAAARDAVTACGDARVLLADVHSAFLTIPHWNKTLLTSDGGLTSDGHEVLHAVIRAALDCGAPAVAPAGLAVDGPDWTKLAAGEA